MIETSWDDGAAQDMRLADLLRKYNLPAVFYWSANSAKTGKPSLNMSRVGKMLTPAECKSIAKNFDVGCHGMKHAYLTDNLDTFTTDLDTEIIKSKQVMEDLFVRKITSFCYPRGRANDDVRARVRAAGYADARNTGVGNTQISPDPIWTTPTVHVGINRKEYNGVPWQEYARKMLDQARHDDHGIYHIFGHSWEIEVNNAWDDLESLFKELT